MPSPRRRIVFLLCSVLLVAALALVAVRWQQHKLRIEELLSAPAPHGAGSLELGRVSASNEWAGSSQCQDCHLEQHESWYRTFHRTMTQVASESTVLGDFRGQALSYQGVVTRPQRSAEGFAFELEIEGSAERQQWQVLRTVGSRRYQQYLVRPASSADPADTGSVYQRFPLLWHIEDRRWVHLNGAFLGADGQPWGKHWAIWNQNCIFCHNTGPVPGLQNYDEMVSRAQRGEQVDSTREGKFASSVAELGISCESCHGPGAEHSRLQRDPLWRLRLRWWPAAEGRGLADPTIVQPEDLAPQQQADLCGQCHGQRTFGGAEDLQRTLQEGPSFRAGDLLAQHVDPVWRQSTVPIRGQEDLFEKRFWADGTARLSAYEYQGLMQSPCFQQGGLSCIDCHSMHGGDVYGQLPEAMRSSQACVDCHSDLVAQVAEHSKHAADSSGSSCYNCHLPKIAYGVMEIHRSHRIERPDPARNAASARPDACTSCHLDRSLAWAAEASQRLWSDSYLEVASRLDGAPAAAVDSVASLLGGDPVQRAVAAKMAGRSDSPLNAIERAFLVPMLIVALEDPYPAVRRFSAQSLAKLLGELQQLGLVSGMAEILETWDFMGPRTERSAAVARLVRIWSQTDKSALPAPPRSSGLGADYLPIPAAVASLQQLAARRSAEVDIGE